MKKLGNTSPFLLLLVPVFIMIILSLSLGNDNQNDKDLAAKPAKTSLGLVKEETRSILK